MRSATTRPRFWIRELHHPGRLPGFKKAVRQGVTLNVASKITINIQMELGAVEQTVTVTGEAPLLDTTTASSGRVIDAKMIDSLPFSDLNPFALTGMASGMQWTGQPEYRRPFDNGGTSASILPAAWARMSTRSMARR